MAHNSRPKSNGSCRMNFWAGSLVPDKHQPTRHNTERTKKKYVGERKGKHLACLCWHSVSDSSWLNNQISIEVVRTKPIENNCDESFCRSEIPYISISIFSWVLGLALRISFFFGSIWLFISLNYYILRRRRVPSPFVPWKFKLVQPQRTQCGNEAGEREMLAVAAVLVKSNRIWIQTIPWRLSWAITHSVAGNRLTETRIIQLT